MVQPDIPRHRGKGHEVNQSALCQAVRHQDGSGVVLSGVGVDNQADFPVHHVLLE